MNLIDITAANTPDAAAAYKGRDAILTMTDDTTISGTFLSVNSKGWNITVDGKTVSRGFGRVAMVQITETDCCITGECENDEMDEDTEAEFIADMIELGVYEDDEIEVAAAEDGIANLDLPGTELDAMVAELDGCTTTELAAVFGIEAKELRVTLRALGMGVGKGRRYHLTNDQVTTVREALNATA